MAALNAMPANWFWRSRDDWYGVYFQDQITLWDKLHIVASYGGIATANVGAPISAMGSLKLEY